MRSGHYLVLDSDPDLKVWTGKGIEDVLAFLHLEQA
jgi:hypothetical protein